jgi:heptosyltransferase-2
LKIEKELKRMSLGNTLIIRPGALGDAILTLPALHSLRLSGARELNILGTPVSWSFLRPSADVALRVHDFSSPAWLGLFAEGAPLSPVARELLSRIQTAIVYLSGDTSVLQRAFKSAGIKTIICSSPPIASTASGSHAAELLLEPIRTLTSAEHAQQALRIADQSDDPLIALSEEELIRAKAELSALGCARFCAIHPGSGGRTKCWPASNFAELALKLPERGLTPLIFFGPADKAVKDELERAMYSAPSTQHSALAVVSRPLREVLALLSCCEGYIGNDSGLTHLAARACPTLALFGPTDPAVWAPLGKNVRVLRAPGGDLRALDVNTVRNAVCGL